MLLLVVAAAGGAYWKFVRPWLRSQPPPASGGDLTVRVLDVGPINGDSILISSPAGKTVLIDAGDTNKGKAVVEALKRHNIQQLDYFIATHPHPDHIGGSAEVFKAVKVLHVIDNGQGPNLPSVPPAKPASKRPAAKNAPSLSRFYDDYKAAVSASGANYATAQPGTKLDLGGGALLTVLAPSEPLFTKEHLKAGGNEPNANSIVLRLDYGRFSMLLAGDAEAQTEHRLLTKELNLEARVLKVGHHGSKYASSESFLKRVNPEIAIISCGAWNRYGHPSQAVLDRLRAANVKLYRTDVHGEITVTTRGAANDSKVTTAKEPTEDVWAGRTAQKDDSARSGFIAYGDFGPPPRPRKSEQK